MSAGISAHGRLRRTTPGAARTAVQKLERGKSAQSASRNSIAPHKKITPTTFPPTIPPRNFRLLGLASGRGPPSSSEFSGEVAEYPRGGPLRPEAWLQGFEHLSHQCRRVYAVFRFRSRQPEAAGVLIPVGDTSINGNLCTLRRGSCPCQPDVRGSLSRKLRTAKRIARSGGEHGQAPRRSRS